MLIKATIAIFLITVTAGTHVSGFALVLRWLWPKDDISLVHGTPALRLMHMIWLLVLAHVLEIGLWALFYHLSHCFPDAESAFYFSGSTYTCVGYGDLLLPIRWRILGPIESLTGILMCGLSASAFFALVSRIVKARSEARTKVG